MNKRIKELADQAGDDQNKFAELIIKDCVECCVLVAQVAIDTRGKELDADFSYWHGREDAASLCKTTIRKHFGEVECDE